MVKLLLRLMAASQYYHKWIIDQLQHGSVLKRAY